jgi:histidyl-tRNA synthetase
MIKKDESNLSANKENQPIVKPEKPAGFLDFLPSDFLAREKMLEIVGRIFRSYGYDQIETAAPEFTNVLTGEDETSKNIFRLVDQGRKSEEQSISLRFDHTVPLARLLAANPYNPTTKEGIKLPWRRMVLGPVYRADSPPQKGRYRQFYHFDVVIVGTSSMLADAEIVAIINETLTALVPNRFLIKINNRKILNGLSELIGLKERPQVKMEDLVKSIFRILDKVDKIGLDAVEKELAQEPANDFDPKPNLSAPAIAKIKSFLGLQGGNEEKLKSALEIFQGIKIAEEGLAEITEILKFCFYLGVPAQNLVVDFSVARGLDYYTGPVMETVLLDAPPELGSIFSGGRYNNLMERFTGQKLPAVGASVGVDRLFFALKELGVINVEKSTAVEVVVIRIDKSLDPQYLQLAKSIRELGYSTEVCFLDDQTFKSQFNYALGRGAYFMAILGADEAARGVVKIKNLLTREQVEVNLSELNQYFTERLIV